MKKIGVPAITAFALAEQEKEKYQNMMQKYQETEEPIYLQKAEKYADAYNQYSFYGIKNL